MSAAGAALEGRAALVTGGSRGIGAGFVTGATLTIDGGANA